MRSKIIFVLLLSLAQTVTARADSLKDSLEQQYKKHVLSLRSPFTKGDQKFDSSGTSLNPPKGTWLTYGGIYVEKLDLKPDALRIQGHRVGFAREKKTRKILLIAQGKLLEIEIRLEKPLQSLDEALSLLDHVFYLKDENLEHAKPEFRRSDDSMAGGPIYSVKDVITHPRAVHTPEPEFSEEARQAKYQGLVTLNVVIDKAGNVARIKLVKAAGYGLDENAMEEVKNWRFDPAKRDGQPVAVTLNIEVSFKLY